MDAIKLYLKAIKDTPLLTAEEEISLAKKVMAGNVHAQKRMIRAVDMVYFKVIGPFSGHDRMLAI